jgi:hypothetical protein
MSPLKPLPYHFVDSSSTAAGPARVSANADSVAAAVDVSTIETDVRYLAAPELQGRLRGTEGNARARAQIVASLEAAGLAPLFSDSFGRALASRAATITACASTGSGRFSSSRPAARRPTTPRATRPTPWITIACARSRPG